MKELAAGRAKVELDVDYLYINMSVDGSALSAARQAVEQGYELESTVRKMLDRGGMLLVHGARQATVQSVAAEVDRLIAVVAQTTVESLPQVLDGHASRIQGILSGHFDAARRDSVQQQLVQVMSDAASEQRAVLLRSLTEGS